ncbi:MAG: hypothetical protein ACTSUK_01010 [Promethearchaeota archaeon]
MNTKTGFFEEKPGVKSNTRLNSSIIIYVGLLIGCFALYLDKPEFNYLSITLVLIGAGKKVSQKYIENGKKNANSVDNTDGN